MDLVAEALVTKRARNLEHERLLFACQETMAQALQESGMTYAQVAAKLGLTTTVVIRAFNTGDNLTLRLAADLLWAMGRRMTPMLEAKG